MFNPASFVNDQLGSEESLPSAGARNGAARQAPVEPNRTPSDEQRVEALADRIAMYVDSLVPQGHVRCLDVGCGDRTLAEAVERRKSRTEWRCIDVHPLPSERREGARRRKDRSFRGRTIPHGDGEFDVAILCDVLHHAPADAPHLLAEAGRVARHVIVKDDWRGTGASSGRHFTRESFVRLVSEQKLRITALDCELDRYERPRGVRLLRKPDRQFIALLNRG